MTKLTAGLLFLLLVLLDVSVAQQERFKKKKPFFFTTTPSSLGDTTCRTESCGTCSNVTSTGGVIESPNFPGDYGTDIACLYYITVPAGKRIRLTLTTLVIRLDLDILIVNDGPEPGVLNAVNMNGFQFLPILTSLGNEITVELYSYGVNDIRPNGTVPSFQATYTVID